MNAKREEHWRHKSYEIALHINSRPSFSKRRRPPIHPDRINPYSKKRRAGISLNTGNQAAESALDAWAYRATERAGKKVAAK